MKIHIQFANEQRNGVHYCMIFVEKYTESGGEITGKTVNADVNLYTQ